MVGLGWSQASVILDYYLFIIMFRSYNYSMRLVVASSRGSIDIDLDDLSYEVHYHAVGVFSCALSEECLLTSR